MNDKEHLVYSRFWVKMYGIFTELVEFFGPSLHAIDPGRKPIFEKIMEVRDRFTDDQLLMITYQRQCNSHVFQNAYKIKLNAKDMNKLKDSFTDQILKKIVTTSDFHAAVAREFATVPIHSLDIGLAVKYASLIKNDFEELYKLGKVWYISGQKK